MNENTLNFSLIGLFLSAILCLSSCCGNSENIVSSPNNVNSISVTPSSSADAIFSFQVKYKDQLVILPSVLQLISEQIDFQGPYTISHIEEQHVDNEWNSTFSELSTIADHYNEVKVFLKSDKASLNIILRSYNEGVAFAYEVPTQAGLESIALDEKITYQFPDDYLVWTTPERQPGVLTAQGEYTKVPLSQINSGCERPLLIEVSDDVKIALAEAKLVDYARLSYSPNPDVKNSILSTLDGRMLDKKQDKVTGAILAKRAEGPKVHKDLPFQSPWRVVMLGDSYGQLLEQNYIIQNLNDPCALEDISWVKPGKVLREVTLTTDGAYSAIDFASTHNMQYIMFDAGWYGNEMDNKSDATTVTLDPKRSKGPLDIQTVVKYGKERGIDVILYINRRALERQLDEILPLLKEWGIAGIKYGFVRVGDQKATAWMHEAIKKTAEYGLIIDVHDEYRPTGFSRTYPNFLTQEGIAGDETTVSNEHTLITMFTRTLAGASDNTVCYYNKRVESMGSHASQLAKTVCIFSPLQFLYWYDKAPDAPIKEDGLWGDTRHIGNEPELEFFNQVPTTWDETRVLHAEISKLGVIARRNGEDWFVGAINGTDANEVELDFSFLDESSKYKAVVYTDDESVKTRTRVAINEYDIDAQQKMMMVLKANNGFAMHIIKK